MENYLNVFYFKKIRMNFVAFRQFFERSLPLLLITAATTSWNFFAAGRISILVPFLFFALILACLAIGDLLVTHFFDNSSRFDSFSTRLLSGFIVINVGLYLLILLLPIGIGASTFLIIFTILCVWIFLKKSKPIAERPATASLETFFLLLSLIAVSFWCQDLFQPMSANATETTIHGWSDIFFHLRQISILASAKGFNSLSDFQMAGAPAHAYHYASYVLPAMVMALTPTTALQAYGGTFVPFGLLLTALAAFSLLSAVMGKWPGAVAGLALLFAPDALQQGFGNNFLSYHWLQHIAPAGMYGVATAAAAWLFIFEGCQKRKIVLICAAYFITLCSVLFKAQIFVANAYLILIFPALFMTGLTRNMRRLYFYVATILFSLTVYFSQFLKGVPTMRLDGTGIDTYGTSLLSSQNQGLFYPLVAHIFQSASGLTYVLGSMLILLFGTFGLWAFIYPLLLPKLKQKLSLPITLFPILITVNYLVMSQGLALDSHMVGRPEELLHRPFVWAYFVVCTWASAGLYFLLFGDAKPKWLFERNRLGLMGGVAISFIIIALMITPAYFGHNIHSLALWRPNVDGVKLTTCFVKSAEYIRTHSKTLELVQDSSNDPDFALTGLTERQAFAIYSGGVRAPDGVHRRLAQLNYRFKNSMLMEEILQFAGQNSIAWYLRRPEDAIMWPSELDNFVSYRCGNYRVYNFPSLLNSSISQTRFESK